MLELQIVDIDLTMPIQEFEEKIKAYIGNHPTTMNYELKNMSTRMGKSMYKLTIDNNDSSSIEIIAERDDANGDIIFHPLKLSNMNQSFYKMSYGDPDIIGQTEDPAMFLSYLLEDLCLKHKGNYACIKTNGTPSLVKEGQTKRANMALVDDDGRVYSCTNAKNIKGASEDTSFTVKKPIGEWLQENTDVQVEISKLANMNDKMNYIGKYLINAKIKEEIDSDEFIDIFCQAGIIGFSDQSVLNIYKLIM